MSDADRTTRFSFKPHRWLINFIGQIVPRSLRADWRQEWEAELRYRELLLADWDKLRWKTKLDLARRSLGAFSDALALQPRRLEDEMLQDLRFGARMLLKNKSFSLVTLISRAVGIGANTAIFSLANAVLFQTPPVADAGRVVSVFGDGRESFAISYPDYRDYRERNQVFTDLLCWGEASLSLSTGGEAEQLTGMLVSGNYFDVLGVQPALGRSFLPDEDRTPGAHPVVVISHGLWQRRFGGTPNMIGQEVNLNGHAFTVIGVAPRGFTSTLSIFAPDAWVPIMMQAQVLPIFEALNARNTRWLQITGRLKPGVNNAQAEANLNMLAKQLAAEYPNREQLVENQAEAGPHEARLLPIGSLPPRTARALGAFMGLLVALVGLVLLIACANLSGLLLARATVRRKEIAVRLALGANRLRIVRQLLTESVLLCLLSGGAGVLLAHWINRGLLSFKPALQLPLELNLQLDMRVLVAALMLSLVTGLLFGLLPALQASKPDLVLTLKDGTYRGGVRGSRLRNLFVVGQVSLSFLLLVCAGLFWRALSTGQQYHPGLEPERIQTATLDPRFLGYDEQRSRTFYHQLLERVRTLPGVEAASLAGSVSVGNSRSTMGLAPVGGESSDLDRLPAVSFNAVTPGHLALLKLHLLRGRDFSETDRQGARRVAMIDETAAREWFGDREALGERLTDGKEEYLIVGVVERANLRAKASQAQPFVYLPVAQAFNTRLVLHVRTEAAAAEAYAAVRSAVSSLDERVPLQFTMPLAEYLRLELLPQRIVAALAGVCGLVGLALAAIGIFGMMSYAVTQRTHEIGIRRALGAQNSDVLRLVMRQGIVIAGSGLLLGWLGALAVTRLLTALLYGVSPTDPLTLTGVSLVLTGIASLACYVPARKAARVDPLVALRHE
jgi:predicted permease